MERPGGFRARVSAASALMVVVVVAAFTLAACGGASTMASNSPSASPSQALASPGPAPRSYALSQREARALVSARRWAGHHFSGSAPEITGYVVDFNADGANVGVYVAAKTGEAMPAGEAWGYVYYLPLWANLPFEKLRPASAGERWATEAAQRTVARWLVGFPHHGFTGQFARLARHWIVAYEVTLTAPDQSGVRKALIDATGEFMGGGSSG